MLSPRHAQEHRSGGDPIQWVQFPDRDEPQDLAGRHEDRGGADRVHGPLPGQFEDVGENCAGSALDGLASPVAKQVASFSRATGATTLLLNPTSSRTLPGWRKWTDKVDRQSGRRSGGQVGK